MSYSVVVQAAGGGAIGVGHLSRTATLANALRSTGFWKRVVLLWETSPELAAYFQPPECEVIIVPDSQTALRERSRLCKQQGIFILVTDLLNIQAEDVAVAKNQGYQAFVHVNDSGIGRFAADMLVDADAFKSLKDLPPSFKGVGLIGAPYRIIRPSVAQLRPLTPWLGDKVNKVLISLGGSDPGNITLQLVQSLYEQQLLPSFSTTIVVGPAFDSTQVNQLQIIVEQNQYLSIIKSPSSLAHLILEHDLIVTLGGITSYEIMCMGKPCAAVAWGSMKYYVEHLNSISLLANLGEVKNAVNCLLKLTNNIGLLHQLAKLGWKKIDGRGADRIATQISNLANTLLM
ncbi:hypothetical protein [Nostoc sp. LEGE 12450]|uniref:hypothetical protein n=1 Tax=Nostoc sp. LEGE 12450 TaxID=1828643 RepID=UPI00187EAE7E|nr:hypothetical protein [Nostoc sp. LEGE 12450]MBE8985971.1 hypothetical protein [Nostoc sp. LEGE 12450]